MVQMHPPKFSFTARGSFFRNNTRKKMGKVVHPLPLSHLPAILAVLSHQHGDPATESGVVPHHPKD